MKTTIKAIFVKFKSAWKWNLFWTLFCLYMAFNFASTFGKRFEEFKDFHFVLKCGMILFVVSFGLAALNSFTPLLGRLRKPPVREQAVADSVFYRFNLMLVLCILVIMVVGFAIIGKEFWELPWDVTKTIWETLKTIFEHFAGK